MSTLTLATLKALCKTADTSLLRGVNLRHPVHIKHLQKPPVVSKLLDQWRGKG
jgi:hypothetical protein